MISRDELKKVKSLKHELKKLNDSFTLSNERKIYAEYTVKTNKQSKECEKGLVKRVRRPETIDLTNSKNVDIDNTKKRQKIIDSFYYNWLILATEFEETLKTEDVYSNINICRCYFRGTDGIPLENLSSKERRDAIENSNTIYTLKLYLEKKHPSKHIAYTAAEGLTEMYDAFMWASSSNPSYENASMHIVRASIALKSLQIQKMEREYKVGLNQIEQSSQKKPLSSGINYQICKSLLMNLKIVIST